MQTSLDMFGSKTEAELVPYQAMTGPPGQAMLVLAPHPDDEVFGCGGLLAMTPKWGSRVRVLVLTDGELGGSALQRRDESRQAAAVLGYGQDLQALQFLGRPDRDLQPDDALLKELTCHAADLGADVVLAPSPFEIHPDHRAACVVGVELALRRGCRLMFYEVGQPLIPNRLLNLTPLLRAKQQAIDCFASQLVVQAYGEQILALNRYRAYTLGPEISHAEGYWQLETEALQLGVPGLLGVHCEALKARFSKGDTKSLMTRARAWLRRAGPGR